MINEHSISRCQACVAVKMSSSTQRYQPRKGKDEQIIALLNELVEKYPAIGFWQCFFHIRRGGHPWNHKRLIGYTRK